MVRAATAIGGEAVYLAARDLRAEILDIAGIALQAARRARHRRRHDRQHGRRRQARCPVGDRRHRTLQLGELPNSVQPMLSHTRRFRLLDDLYIFTNGIHGCLCGGGRRHRLRQAPEDVGGRGCGRVINPQLADEQVRGGCVQGLGGALYEHCIYDDAGQLRRHHGRLPRADGLRDARYRRHAHPDADISVGAGAKGVGKSGTGAAPAVVMNAFNDALRPFNARVTTHPITPEVILTALGKV